MVKVKNNKSVYGDNIYFYTVKDSDTRPLLIEIYNRSKGLAVVIRKGKDVNCIGKMKIPLKDALNEESNSINNHSLFILINVVSDDVVNIACRHLDVLPPCK
jgi:hypothetical protein